MLPAVDASLLQSEAVALARLGPADGIEPPSVVPLVTINEAGALVCSTTYDERACHHDLSGKP